MYSHYDAAAERYDALYSQPLDRAENWALTQWLLYRNLLNPAYQTLDLGCGTGLVLDLANHLQRPLHRDRYLGVDPSQGMLDVLRRKHPGYDTLRAGAEELGLIPLSTFDVVLSTFCALSYADEEDGWNGLMSVCRPGTRVFAMLFTQHGLQRPSYLEQGSGDGARPYTRAHAYHLMRRFGLRDTLVNGFGDPALDGLPPETKEIAFRMRLVRSQCGDMDPDDCCYLMLEGTV